MKCEFCEISEAVFEGWFYAVAPNEFNRGTADTGLLQLRQVCKHCAEEAIKNGRSKAKELPC